VETLLVDLLIDTAMLKWIQSNQAIQQVSIVQTGFELKGPQCLCLLNTTINQQLHITNNYQKQSGRNQALGFMGQSKTGMYRFGTICPGCCQ
jgi:hypothetical protein